MVILSEEPAVELTVQVGDTGVGVFGFQEVSSWGDTYWCVSAGLKNFDSSEAYYTMFDFSLLTPTGNLDPATIPIVQDYDSLLSSGQLAPDGYVTGVVCFDAPRDPVGRFAVVYAPFSLWDDGRAVYYFDRS